MSVWHAEALCRVCSVLCSFAMTHSTSGWPNHDLRPYPEFRSRFYTVTCQLIPRSSAGRAGTEAPRGGRQGRRRRGAGVLAEPGVVAAGHDGGGGAPDAARLR